MTRLALLLAAVALSHAAGPRRPWAPDTGNGTYSNPLFYDEFPDSGMIRVGSDYYLTGTTMHAMPGLPIPHSRHGDGRMVGLFHRVRGSGNRNVLALVDGRLHSAASPPTAFKVVERGRGRIELQTASGQYLSVADAGIGVTSARPGDGEPFQWVDLERGDTLLLSVSTHRYLVVPKTPGPARADHPGPAPDRKDGSCFQ